MRWFKNDLQTPHRKGRVNVSEEKKCDQCEGYCLCSSCGSCFPSPSLCPLCVMKGVTPPTKSPTVTVDRQEWERAKADNTTMYEALQSICYHGTDNPAGMGGPDPAEDVSWWKSIAHSCMRKANNALKEIATPSNAVEPQPTQ